jgi:hypothetical protein
MFPDRIPVRYQNVSVPVNPLGSWPLNKMFQNTADSIPILFQYLMCVCAAGVAEAATYPLDLTKTRYSIVPVPHTRFEPSPCIFFLAHVFGWKKTMVQ